MKLAQVAARAMSPERCMVLKIIQKLDGLSRDELVDKDELGQMLGISGKWALTVGLKVPEKYTTLVKINGPKTRYWGHPEAIKKIRAILDGQTKDI